MATGKLGALVVAGAVFGGVALVAAPARAQESSGIKAAARTLIEKYQDAIVNVKLATKQKVLMNGQQVQAKDSQLEVLGTVIDPSGLTVIAESETDPNALMKAAGGSMPGLEFYNEIVEAKIVLKDGKEVPARLLLRDKDLDLAFVAPDEKGLKLAHVALEKMKDPEIFDDILLLGRLGRNLDRAPTVSANKVRALVRKPRTFYVCGDPLAALTGGLGGPAFDAAGKPIGVLVMRRGPELAGGAASLSALFGSMTPIVLPAEDIAEVAQQALAEAAKPPAKTEPAAAPASSPTPGAGVPPAPAETPEKS